MNQQFNSKIIFLDHNKIVSELYRDANGKYSLTNQIFNYERKEHPPKAEFNPNAKSRKRKRKKLNISPSLDIEKKIESFIADHKLEIQHLKNSIDEFNSKKFILPLNQIVIESKLNLEDFFYTQNLEPRPGLEDHNNTSTSKSGRKEKLHFETVLNNCNKFSNFHGSNQTETIQKVSMNNEIFLIPPKCNFYNNNISDLKNIEFDSKFDFIVMDPPWKNKFIRRLKKSLYKNKSAYEMLSNKDIEDIPIQDLIHENSVVAIWCTNSRQNQQAIINEFYPKWNLKFIAKIYWMKIDGNGKTICDINDEYGQKQPYEVLYIATNVKNCSTDLKKLKDMNGCCIFSIPSLIHSHKPPIIQIFKEFLTENKNKNFLEIFARYLQPNFTSIGLEVLKLMDERFYDFTK